jgi:hypothetical protein
MTLIRLKKLQIKVDYNMKFNKIFLCKKNRRPIVCVSAGVFLLLLFILLFLFRRKLVSFIFTIMLLGLGCLSSQFKKLTGDLDTGLEFIPFATIIFFYTHGIAFGLLSVLFMMSISSLLVGQLKLDLFISLGIFILVAFASFFFNFGIVMNGIILIIIFNILSFIILTLFGFDFVKNSIYFFGSLLFNYILFKYFSVFIVTALTL